MVLGRFPGNASRVKRDDPAQRAGPEGRGRQAESIFALAPLKAAH